MRQIILAVAAATLLQACSADTTAPVPVIAGTYQAFAQGVAKNTNRGALVFTATTGNETIDWLARGAEISLELRDDGTTVGRMYIPGIDENGNEGDKLAWVSDLAGTWTLTNGKIRLQQNADTFLRDMEYTVEAGTLTAERTFGEVKIRVVLLRLS